VRQNRTDHFLADNGLDTSPILLQKAVEILDTDTLGSLYFDRLYPLGVAARWRPLIWYRPTRRLK
jgi:hypothetical protein